jgi:hypothetical protein
VTLRTTSVQSSPTRLTGWLMMVREQAPSDNANNDTTTAMERLTGR